MENFFIINDNFEEIIRRELPGLSRMEKIPTGWTNFVFHASTKRYSYIFRFPRNDFFAAALKKEVELTKFIRKKLHVKTARLHYKTHEGRGFSMHKLIKGHVLTEAFPNLTHTQKIRLGGDINKYIKRLQQIDAHELLMKVSPEHFLLSSFLRDLAGVNGGEYDFGRLTCLVDLEMKNLVLVHGDLNPGNIILNRRMRLCAVLDYAFMSYSAEIIDVSRIVGRLPDFKPYIVGAGGAQVDMLSELWNYVEADYIEYVKREQHDIVLPEGM